MKSNTIFRQKLWAIAVTHVNQFPCSGFKALSLLLTPVNEANPAGHFNYRLLLCN